jgi:hypothetical protein
VLWLSPVKISASAETSSCMLLQKRKSKHVCGKIPHWHHGRKSPSCKQRTTVWFMVTWQMFSYEGIKILDASSQKSQQRRWLERTTGLFQCSNWIFDKVHIVSQTGLGFKANHINYLVLG